MELRAKVLEKAEELGLPPYAPVELHIVSEDYLRRYSARGKVAVSS